MSSNADESDSDNEWSPGQLRRENNRARAERLQQRTERLQRINRELDDEATDDKDDEDPSEPSDYVDDTDDDDWNSDSEDDEENGEEDDEEGGQEGDEPGASSDTPAPAPQQTGSKRPRSPESPPPLPFEDETEVRPPPGMPSPPENLNCPVCLELVSPPVLQCNEGHLLCGECFENVCRKSGGPRARCPTCRVVFPPQPARNRAIENMLPAWYKPCPHTGCTARFPRTERGGKDYELHVTELCPKIPVPCGFPRCACRSFPMDALHRHYEEEHGDEIHEDFDGYLKIKLTDLGNPMRFKSSYTSGRMNNFYEIRLCREDHGNRLPVHSQMTKTIFVTIVCFSQKYDAPGCLLVQQFYVGPDAGGTPPYNAMKKSGDIELIHKSTDQESLCIAEWKTTSGPLKARTISGLMEARRCGNIEGVCSKASRCGATAIYLPSALSWYPYDPEKGEFILELEGCMTQEL